MREFKLVLRATGPSGPQALSLVNCSAYTSPELDENSAPSMCYTSGTTGNPKAALYSHRSTLESGTNRGLETVTLP